MKYDPSTKTLTITIPLEIKALALISGKIITLLLLITTGVIFGLIIFIRLFFVTGENWLWNALGIFALLVLFDLGVFIVYNFNKFKGQFVDLFTLKKTGN